MYMENRLESQGEENKEQEEKNFKNGYVVIATGEAKAMIKWIFERKSWRRGKLEEGGVGSNF